MFPRTQLPDRYWDDCDSGKAYEILIESTSMDASIAELFPEIEEIEDDNIREVVVASWGIVREESGGEPLSDVHWAPHYSDEAGEQNLIRHIRDVVLLATDMSDRLSDLRDIEIDRDHVIGGALLHDISKPFEHEGNSHTELREFLEHPHFSVYVLEKAGAPVHIQHIALSHTPRSGVMPKTIESVIVKQADELAMDGIFCEATGDIKAI